MCSEIVVNFDSLFTGAQIFDCGFLPHFNRFRQNLGWLGALVSSIPWKIWVNFGPHFRGTQIFDRGYLGTLLVGSPQNFARLGVWPMDISSPNLVNFDSGIRRCHAATCISPCDVKLCEEVFF